MSADIMASLCGVRMIIFSSKSTRPRDMRLLLKDTLPIEEINRKINADLSVYLFSRSIRSEVPPPFQHFITNLSL